MLLDSDSSLKVAHDIIYDANEILRLKKTALELVEKAALPEDDPERAKLPGLSKWAQLLAMPGDPRLPEDSTVPYGYVEFNYSDGSVFRVPCVWYVMLFSGTNVHEKWVFRRNGITGTWMLASKETAVPGGHGVIFGVFSDVPVKMGVLECNRLIALKNADYEDSLTLVAPDIRTLAGSSLNVSGATIGNLAVTGEGAIENGTFVDLNVPDGAVGLDTPGNSAEFTRADTIDATELICGGEQVVPVEKFNAWLTAPGTEGTIRTDAQYTSYIPFAALSGNGMPINGFDAPLVDNPFYPDYIYVGDSTSPWKPEFAWVPSATRPGVPYWRDSDGIYWYKVHVTTSASMYGSPYLIWPVRTVSDASYADSTVPPMKAEADGMVITVKALSSSPVPVCLTDRYTFKNGSEWTWEPGITREITGPRICQFMARRDLIWSNNMIVAVEYQFLPVGDMDG